MANYILVPFNSSDQIEEIIPRIEEVAQAGIAVTFLTRYQRYGLFKNRWLRSELSTRDMLTDGRALLKYPNSGLSL